MSETIIHQTAIVSKKAKIGSGVSIGAWTIIEDDVEIGDNTKIASSVVIADGGRVGNDCQISAGVVIATNPQDLKFGGEKTYAIIGDRTVIREYATINRATSATGRTIVGSDCMLMAYTHVAHDCHLGDNIIMANAVQLAGHVEIEDWVTVGGVVKVHQFCRIGCHSMIGADAKLVKDVVPYAMIGDKPTKIEGFNKIGLRRRGFSTELIKEIEQFYRIMFQSGLNTSDALEKYRSEQVNILPELLHCINFVEASKRGIYK